MVCPLWRHAAGIPAGPRPSGEAKEKNARVGHCADPCRRGGAHHRLVSALPEQRSADPNRPGAAGDLPNDYKSFFDNYFTANEEAEECTIPTVQTTERVT